MRARMLYKTSKTECDKCMLSDLIDTWFTNYVIHLQVVVVMDSSISDLA